MTQIKTPEQAKRKAREWAKRLNALYATVEGWMRAIDSNVQFAHDKTPKVIDYDFGKEYPGVIWLPTLKARLGDDEIYFYPSAMRIVGAEGRVDVVRNLKVYLFQLIDHPELGDQPREWKIVGYTADQNLVPLTESSFREYGRFDLPAASIADE